MDKTPFTYVDTEEKLKEMAAILDGAQEIAVDLEVLSRSVHVIQFLI